MTTALDVDLKKLKARAFDLTGRNGHAFASLREAIETKGPRTVLFRVGGVIETKGLEIREPYITIAGQTAPGDGICIKRVESGGGAMPWPAPVFASRKCPQAHRIGRPAISSTVRGLCR